MLNQKIKFNEIGENICGIKIIKRSNKKSNFITYFKGKMKYRTFKISELNIYNYNLSTFLNTITNG